MNTIIVLISENYIKNISANAFNPVDVGVKTAPDTVFRPNDPDASDKELRRYYSATVENEAEAKKLVDDLIGLPAVEAAWIKPREEPPE